VKFVDCKIIVKSKKDKEEFIKACKHLHDFSVFFNENKKITSIVDEFGREKIKPKVRKLSQDACGVGLDLDSYPFINFLARLYDCDDVKVRDKYIKVEK
jgi:hypothetical protein